MYSGYTKLSSLTVIAAAKRPHRSSVLRHDESVRVAASHLTHLSQVAHLSWHEAPVAVAMTCQK